jgi:class 3 adenylate cyclase
VRKRSTLVAWSMLAIFFVGWTVMSVLLVANGNLQEPADGLAFLLAFGAFMFVGALIVAHRPGNAIGWIFSAIGLLAATGGLAQEYAQYAYVTRPGSLPGAVLPAWYASWWWYPAITLALVFTLLWFPTGRPLSARWRPVAVVAAIATAALVALTALQPTLTLREADYAVDNPIGLAGIQHPEQSTQGAVLFLLLTGCMLAAVLSMVLRFRRSRGVERQQLKWFTYAGALLILWALVSGFLFPNASLDVIFALFLAFVPIAAGIAILRYRLYDIDHLISRTLSYTLLTAAFTAVYLVIVVGIGTLVGSRGKPNLFLSIVATAVIAVAFQPARDRSRRLANRLVYGKRATPYEVLSGFSRSMAHASTDDSLLRMARLVVEATGAVQATVWLRLGEVLQPEASWPQAGPLPQPIALEGRGVQEALAVAQATSVSFPVGYEEELLGALTVTISPAEPLTVAGEKLIGDLATQTGLGLRFQRMKERALFARALASFLPPEVAELVEASPSALSLREELEATILFSDIRGFSSLAERLPPRQVAEVVGRHLAAMVEVVTSHGGVLDKFAGDAVMAVFGAPRPSEDHARRALSCAAAMQRRQRALNDEAERADLAAFQIGIGVNTGTVIAGTLGGPGRLDYTVLGDAVNIAQRLQSEASGGEILAAAVTVRLAGTDLAEPVGLKQLKGRQHLVEVYRIRWAETSTAQHPGETAYAE